MKKKRLKVGMDNWLFFITYDPIRALQQYYL